VPLRRCWAQVRGVMPRPEPGASSGNHGSFSADFFEKHLSKMMMAPSFAQVSVPPHADASKRGAVPDNFGPPLRVTESDMSTQSGGLQVDRSGSASTAGDAPHTASAMAADFAFASMACNRNSLPPPAGRAEAGYPDPTASYMAADAMSHMGASSGTSYSYKVGENIEVWSKTHQAWCRGIVESLEDGLVNLKYTVPDGSSMTKLMPNGHEQLRPAAAPQPAANVSASSSFRPGDHVEVFSNSHQTWCPGCVEAIDGAMVNVRYMTPEGLPMTKMIPDGHAHLRLMLKPQENRQEFRQDHGQEVRQDPHSPMRSYANPARNGDHHQDPHSPMRSYGNPARNGPHPPPPPPPFERMQPAYMGESVLDRAPPPEMSAGISVHASPMASIQHNSNQAPSCMASQQAWQQEINANAGPGLAETQARVPPSPMVLCGMPIKNGACGTNKPVGLAKQDRCCRCAMPVGGSYFDHTCPKCSAIICRACLEDLKCVVNSYRCPSCGDSENNEETLKNTLWSLKMYRSAQRAVSAVPTLMAGLFGTGPEAGFKAPLPGLAEEPMEEPISPPPPMMTAEPVHPQPAAPSAPRVVAADPAAAASAGAAAAPAQAQDPLEGRVFTNSFATFWGAGAPYPKKKGSKAADPGKTLLDEYKAGDPIEVWSNSVQAWLRGFVEKVDDGMVNVKYFTASGQAITKLLPDGHADIRHAPTTKYASAPAQSQAPAPPAAPEPSAKNIATGTQLISKPGPPSAPNGMAANGAGAAGAPTGTPDYQTQPPVGWFEGAGCGADPAAIAMLQAAAAPKAAAARAPAAPSPAGGLQKPDLFRGLAAVHPQQQPQQQQPQRAKTPDKRASQPARAGQMGMSPMGDAFQTRLPNDQRSPMRG